MISSHLLPAPCQWFVRLASALDRRSAIRLALLSLARGRRTVTSWFRAAGFSDRFRSCHTAVLEASASLTLESVRTVMTSTRSPRERPRRQRRGGAGPAVVNFETAGLLCGAFWAAIVAATRRPS
jgi:hypothetical protein